MSRDDVIRELTSLAQQSEDAIRANEAGTAAFRDEWERLCTATVVNQDRMREIYAYMVEWPREAARLRREAETFRAAIALLS
jgi:hypothetical protein